MARVPSHYHCSTSPPASVGDYFEPERTTVEAYLDTVPNRVDLAGDATIGPIQPLPWLYVADQTGWRGGALASLLAAERDCPCYRLPVHARDAESALWTIIDESAGGPVVVHLELRGDSGHLPETLRQAVGRGYRYAFADADRESVDGEPANVLAVFTDTWPSKRLTSPLPDATTPFVGAALSYAPRRSMVPEQPDGTTHLADPPTLQERDEKLAALLTDALAERGTDSDRDRYVDAAVDALVTTHALVGEHDLLFDVSPRTAIKHGQRLDDESVDDALAGLRTDLLQQVPQSPGSQAVRETLSDLLSS